MSNNCTITGTILDTSGSPVTSGQVVFTLRPSLDVTISGIGRFDPPAPATAKINPDGMITAEDGTAFTLVKNTALSPNGTYYEVSIQPSFATGGASFWTFITSDTLDLSTVTPTPEGGPFSYNPGIVGPAGPTGPTGPVGPASTVPGPTGPPTTFLGPYNAGATYATGQGVHGSDGSMYVSLVNANIGNDPTTSPSQWGLAAAAGSITFPVVTPATFSNKLAANIGIIFPGDSEIINWSATKQYRDGILDKTGTRYLSYDALDNTVHAPLPVDALAQLGLPAGIVTDAAKVTFPIQVIDPATSPAWSNTKDINSGTVDETGTRIVGTFEPEPVPSPTIVNTLPIDLDGAIDAVAAMTALNLCTCGGQSVEYGSDGTPLVDSTPSATNLMPSNGIDYDFGGGVSPSGTPIALVEATTQTGKIALSESVATYVAARGFKHIMGIASSALPGASLADINVGTAPFIAMQNQITAFHAFAVAGSKSFRHVVHQFDQAQTESTSPSAWQAAMVTYQQSVQSASNTITGNSGDIPLHIMQNDVLAFAQAQQNLEILYPGQFRVVGPDYCLEHHSTADVGVSAYHLTANGYMQKGEQYAKAYKWEILQRRRWRNLQPIRVTADRYAVKIKYFVPYGPIAFDTSRVVNAIDGNYGFFMNGATLLSATITGIDEVTLTLDRCAPPGLVVGYGNAIYGGTDSTGRLNGSVGGCLVDSWPEMSLYPNYTTGSHYQLKNYSSMWNYVVA